MTSVLGLGTLILTLIIAVVMLLRFVRKPESRHRMDRQRERNIQQIRQVAENGSINGELDESRTPH